MPEPFGEAVITNTTMEANLNHCLATGKSLTGCLHFVNKTPIDWYSKKQVTVETATYYQKMYQRHFQRLLVWLPREYL